MTDSNPRPMHGLLVLAASLAAGVVPTAAMAQGAAHTHAIGATAQLYPAGVNLAARASFPIGDRNTLSAHGGYNVTDRRDFGEHDNEEGGGPGFGFAVRRYLEERYNGFHIGVRTDLWFLAIDWEDNAPPRSDRTNVVVLQPTAQAGYSRTLSGGRVVLEATVSLGAEINVRTGGEAVGEGAILLVGVGIAYRR
jgi:hypothetical protein